MFDASTRHFYSPTDGPYLASFLSSNLKLFRAYERPTTPSGISLARARARAPDDDFRHIPHVKTPTAIFLPADVYTASRGSRAILTLDRLG